MPQDGPNIVAQQGRPVADWHSQPALAVLEALAATPNGLSSEEARRRLEQHGPNALPVTQRPHPLRRLLAQFHNALIYFLLAGAAAAWSLGHQIDAFVILAVVLVNAVVGFVQEGKAEKALNAIRSMIAPRASVTRDGQRVSLPVEQLVPGDVVLLEAGDRVPADLRLLRAHALRIDEALLTGESVASNKDLAPVPPNAPLGDRRCLAFSGSLVSAGSGAGVVVATGQRTEIGHISTLVGSVQELTTPLLRQVNAFGGRFTAVAIVAAVLLFAFAVTVRDYDWADALIAVVALAVGVVPEGLPAVITITLAIGVQRMAARNAVIRRLPAVETLGATSVICSDKTGTLTRNEMTACRVMTASAEISVSGSGYAPDGKLTTVGVSADDDAEAIALAAPLLRVALLCNDAQLKRAAAHWVVEGDPMEGALLTLGRKAGLEPDHLRAEWPRLDEIPFDAQHRFMAVLSQGPDGETWLFVKGAPEALLQRCSHQAEQEGEVAVDRPLWKEHIVRAAASGQRVLAFAARRVPQGRQITPAVLETGLTFLGLAAFIDPPRDEAITAIRRCRAAGIAVKMITGDHAETAAAIARQIGLDEAPVTMTGAELDTLSDEALAPVVSRASVFARTSPEHKLRIVRALQAQGHVVAMTGDGVNDAPSLKQADIGIAMGHKGTEAAKEASQMVLMDDDFASIVAAVHEGRVVYDNIRKVIAWTLPTNGGEVMTVIAAILLGFTMPMTAAQILWINMVTTITLGLILAFESAEPGVMRRKPRPRHGSLLSPFLLWRVTFVSVLFMAGALAIFFHALNRGLGEDVARTLVVNTIVVLEIFYLFNVRYLHMTSITLRGVLGTPAVLIALLLIILAQLAFTYLPVLQQLFATAPAPLLESALVPLLGVALLLILEAEKMLLRRLGLFAAEV
jgi:magnesium-transporting ATPase (P-type)